MKTEFKIGDLVKFRNYGAFPSFSGSIGTVTSLPDKDYSYYGVKFESTQTDITPYSMACCESELILIQ